MECSTSNEILFRGEIDKILSNDAESLANRVAELPEIIQTLQMSCLPLDVINVTITRLIDKVTFCHAKPVEENFMNSKMVSFSESSSQWKSVFIQALITQPGEMLVEVLSKRIFLQKTDFDLLPWEILLPLVSVVAVAVKRGVSMIKDLLHQLLASFFSSSMDPSTSQNADMVLSDIADDDDDNDSGMDEDVVLHSFRLNHVLLIARQLFTEDTRIVGSSYQQWWTDLVSSSPFVANSVLVSRRSVQYFYSQLLFTLPYDNSAHFLHAQLSAIPYWISSAAETDFGNQDISWRDSWLDYVDVGKGRLAELRMCTTPENVMSISQENLIDSSKLVEVKALLLEFSSTSPRLPACLVEMNLFRPQYLRQTIIPLLRCATSWVDLDESLSALRILFIQTLEKMTFQRKPKKAVKRVRRIPPKPI